MAAPGPNAQRPQPAWFTEFLADRGTRKPSAHTMAAYRRDFDAIAEIIAGGPDIAALSLQHLTRDALRTAFSVFAQTHAAASIRRAWSTWNTLCDFLYSSELIPANPMSAVSRPKVGKTLPKSLSGNVIDALLETLETDEERRRDSWASRDRTIILTALLTGLRLDELVGLNIGDIRTLADGAVLHVRGKGNKDRRVPIEAPLLAVLQDYLASRAARFPAGGRRPHAPGAGLGGWPAAAPLFVDARDGTRITRNTLQYRVLRAFRRADIDTERQRGALVHGLRHTFATDLANAEVNVYQLKTLLGHESLATSQRYIDGAGQQTRDAAARNPLYRRLTDR